MVNKSEEMNVWTEKKIEDIFPDVPLALAVANLLGRKVDELVTQNELETVTHSLWVTHQEVKDLEGLQYLINLERLCLYDNEITDISCLANLKKLEFLGLSGNKITNLQPLKELTALKRLYMAHNQINDLAPLSNLTELQDLDLGNNKIVEINSLSNLKKLSLLWLNENKIKDISKLSGLSRLNEIQLSHNEIVDITPLKNFEEIWYLILNGNQIYDLRPLEKIKAREISVCDQVIKLEPQVTNKGTHIPLLTPNSKTPPLSSEQPFSYQEDEKKIKWDLTGDNQLTWDYGDEEKVVSFSGTLFQTKVKGIETIDCDICHGKKSPTKELSKQENSSFYNQFKKIFKILAKG